MRRAAVALLLAAACVRGPGASAADIEMPDARAAPILREANKLGGRYGLELEKGDLRDAWRRHLSALERAVEPHEGARAGLPEPRVVALTPEEQAQPYRAKFLTGRGWEYGDKLPAKGALEGWTRTVLSGAVRVGGSLVVQNGAAGGEWRKMKWQPGKARWASYTEAEEKRYVAAVAAGEAYAPDPGAKAAAREECDRLQKIVDGVAKSGKKVARYRDAMKDAIVKALTEKIRQAAAAELASR